MNTAVAISLDYERCDARTCEISWKTLYVLFLEAGFELHERLFVSPHPYSQTLPQIRHTLQQASDELSEQNIQLHHVVRSCQAFEYENFARLPVPGSFDEAGFALLHALRSNGDLSDCH